MDKSTNVDKQALDLLHRGIIAVASKALSPLTDQQREALHRESWLTILQRDRHAFTNTIAFEETIERLRKTQVAEEGEVYKEEAALMECLHYLVWCEGPFQTILAEICFLAVNAGAKFVVKRYPKEKPLSSAEDILETSVTEKTRFLHGEGIIIPQGIFDVKLRNAVAHMDFEVTGEGEIRYDSRRIDLWRLQRKNWAMRDTCVTMQEAIADGVGLYLPK